VPVGTISLAEDTWYDNEFSGGSGSCYHYYQFYGESGAAYHIARNDLSEGDGTKTCNIHVGAFLNGGFLFDVDAGGWSDPPEIILPASGTVVLRVVRAGGGSTEGTYAVRYY
jgi:hypothetical protein